ncbi:MAG TPA: hypothetical protein VGX92_14195 [Pyrinomonadaceae bacterium]|nr:hypothetical protein [Pyrinomonadaceae bacterium]
MRSRHRTILLSLILVVGLFITACPSRETISKINADPGRYRDKQVTVAGTVTDSYGLLDMGIYEIDDGTGKLLVVTRRGIPSRGSKVGATGRIYTGGNYGGRSYGTVLEESERRAAK